jgi:hypothetical protein
MLQPITEISVSDKAVTHLPLARLLRYLPAPKPLIHVLTLHIPDLDPAWRRLVGPNNGAAISNRPDGTSQTSGHSLDKH